MDVMHFFYIFVSCGCFTTVLHFKMASKTTSRVSANCYNGIEKQEGKKQRIENETRCNLMQDTSLAEVTSLKELGDYF